MFSYKKIFKAKKQAQAILIEQKLFRGTKKL